MLGSTGRWQTTGVQPQFHCRNRVGALTCLAPAQGLEHADQNAVTVERKKQEMVLQNIFALNKIYCNANIQFDTFIIVIAWTSAVSVSKIFYFLL